MAEKRNANVPHARPEGVSPSGIRRSAGETPWFPAFEGNWRNYLLADNPRLDQTGERRGLVEDMSRRLREGPLGGGRIACG